MRSYQKFAGDVLIEEGHHEFDWSELRGHRDAELRRTDFWALKDHVMSQARKDYRQALRDLPQVHDHANDAADAWPTPPE